MSSSETGLGKWRDSLLAEVRSSDIRLSTRALLRLTYEDPDPQWLERTLLDCLSVEMDPQVRALAVTCLGHLARIHHVISDDAIQQLEGLLEDRVLGGQAEDALGDISYFARDRSNLD